MIQVIVAFPKLEDGKNIKKLLERNGCNVAAVCASGAQVLQAANRLSGGVVITGYRINDMIYTQLHESLPSEFAMLLVASRHILEQCYEDGIVKLPLPLKVHDLVNTLEMMSVSLRRRAGKKKPLPKARSEKDKKVIEKAKQLLMERNNMSEEEAHRYLQKCSMDSGNSMVESAYMIFSLMKF